MSAGLDDDPAPVFPEDADFEAVQAALTRAGLADGLPQTPPTARRLAAMLAGVAAPDRSYGQLFPMMGDLTPRAVAYNCVLAGCAPGALPIVLTAANACTAPDFNLLGLLTTTGTPAIALVVHGPAVQALGMNAGINCLGPGNRANATLGRALSLVMRNIGGAKEEIGDMATMGQPGKYGFCLAEAPDGPFPSLADRRGIPDGVSAVTVLGVSGTMEVLPLDERDTPEAILRPVAAALLAARAVAGSGRVRPPGEQAFLFPPELAAAVVRAGWDLARVQAYLMDAASIDMPGVARFERAGPLAEAPGDILAIVTGGPGIKMTCLPLWAGGSVTQTRAILDLERSDAP